MGRHRVGIESGISTLGKRERKRITGTGKCYKCTSVAKLYRVCSLWSEILSDTCMKSVLYVRVTTRMCNRDTDVCGYRVPQGAKVIINMLEIHMDPEHWGPEPVEQFVPER